MHNRDAQYLFFQNKPETDTFIFGLANTETCIFIAFVIFKFI